MNDAAADRDAMLRPSKRWFGARMRTGAALVAIAVAAVLVVARAVVSVAGPETGVRDAAASNSAAVNCPPAASRSVLPLLLRLSENRAVSAPYLNADSACIELVQGTTGSVRLTLASASPDTSLALTLDGPPSGVAGTFDPPTLGTTGSSTLTLRIARTTAAGNYDLAVTGAGGSTAIAKSLTLNVVQPLIIAGRVQYDTGATVSGAQIAARTEDSQATATATTGSDGTYSVELAARTVPAKVLVTAALSATGQPTVTNNKWQTFSARGAGQMDPIALPNTAGAQMTLASGNATTADGSVRAAGLPSTVAQVYGRAYHPVTDRAAFPGEFAERGQIPLLSAGFLWVQARDTAGRAVQTFTSPVTLRQKLPRDLWSTLEDLQTGTRRIEIPIYTYDEQRQQWVDQGTGWLEDGQGTVLPEEALPTINAMTLPGDLYATYTTTHFSYMNVDYPYIGPWTLSRMDATHRQNDCLYKAAQLAKTIFRSRWGKAAFADVNKPGADPTTELPDGKGAELKSATAAQLEPGGATTYGENFPTSVRATDADDWKKNIYLNEGLWSKCDEKKNATIFMMAVTILHENAHWKDNNLKHGSFGHNVNGEESGIHVEKALFGGRTIWASGDSPFPLTGVSSQSGGDPLAPVSDDQLSKFSDPTWWTNNDANFGPDFWNRFWAGGGRAAGAVAVPPASPLQIALTSSQTVFDLGAPIPVTVQYLNTSSSPIRVLGLTVLEGYPLSFDILDGAGNRVPFRGTAKKIHLSDAAFVVLPPGGTLQRSLDLVVGPAAGSQQYVFPRGGAYTVTAVYAPSFGIPRTTSSPLQITVGTGGGVAGRVTSATTGQGIAGATVRAIRNSTDAASVTTGADGSYSIPELPAGTYTLDISAAGYLRASQTATVTVGGTASASVSLSPLLVGGERRVVLSWGATPSDLDLHLWLPDQKKYHLFYSRRGQATPCPWAVLDHDVTSGSGPETITISQRVNTGTYTVAVHNYSSTPDITTSGAQVQVFDTRGVVATYRIPTQPTGMRWWKVATIDGPTGAITDVNQLVADAAPYADTSTGCDTPAGGAAAQEASEVPSPKATVTKPRRRTRRRPTAGGPRRGGSGLRSGQVSTRERAST